MHFVHVLSRPITILSCLILLKWVLFLSYLYQLRPAHVLSLSRILSGLISIKCDSWLSYLVWVQSFLVLSCSSPISSVQSFHVLYCSRPICAGVRPFCAGVLGWLKKISCGKCSCGKCGCGKCYLLCYFVAFVEQRVSNKEWRVKSNELRGRSKE